MNCQEWMNLLPTFLTIIGWIAAFLIAIWQYKKARKQSVSMEVFKQFLEVYTKLAMAISQLKDNGARMENAMNITDKIKEGVHDPKSVTIDISGIDKMEEAFKQMKVNLMLLDVWLSAVQITLPNAKDIQSGKNHFVQKMDKDWVPLSIELNIMKIRNRHETIKFLEHWQPVKATVEEFEQSLQNQASKVESWLLAD